MKMPLAILRDAVVFRIVRQNPAIISDTSDQDPDFMSGNFFCGYTGSQ